MQKLLQEARMLHQKIVSNNQWCDIHIMGVTVHLHDVYISQDVYILHVEYENAVRRQYEVPCDPAHLQQIVNILESRVEHGRTDRHQ